MTSKSKLTSSIGNGMYWSACISTCDSSSSSRSVRHLDDLGDRGVAADRDRASLARAPERLTARRDGFADGLGVDDGLFVDRVRRRRLGRVGLDAVLPTAHAELDQLDRGGGDVEPRRAGMSAWNSTLFPFSVQRLGAITRSDSRNPGGNYIQPGVKLNVSSLIHRAFPEPSRSLVTATPRLCRVPGEPNRP